MRKASLKMDCMPNFDAKESRGKGARFGFGKRHKGAGGMPVTSIRFQCAWRPLLDRGPNEPTNKVAADHRLEVVWVIELLLNGRSPCQLFHGFSRNAVFQTHISRPLRRGSRGNGGPGHIKFLLCPVFSCEDTGADYELIFCPGVLTREDRAQQKLDALAIARPGLLVPVRAQPFIH